MIELGSPVILFDKVSGNSGFFFIEDFMTFVGAPHDRRYVILQMQFVILKNQRPITKSHSTTSTVARYRLFILTSRCQVAARAARATRAVIG